jgi:hypothetical protein
VRAFPFLSDDIAQKCTASLRNALTHPPLDLPGNNGRRSRGSTPSSIWKISATIQPTDQLSIDWAYSPLHKITCAHLKDKATSTGARGHVLHRVPCVSGGECNLVKGVGCVVRANALLAV